MGVTFTTNVMQAQSKNATGISVPEEVIVALGGNKKPSVTVSLNGYTYRSTIAVMNNQFLIPLSQADREASGLKADDPVEVTLELDLEPRIIEVPEELRAALSAHKGAIEKFEAIAVSKRKEFVRQVVDAKTQETRDRRIQGIVAQFNVNT